MPEFSAPGNYKDPEKIAAHVAQQKADWMKEAALRPESGCVLAIGILGDEDQFQLCAHADERDTITHFWDEVGYLPHHDEQWAGWNIFAFDLPFLIRRSWILHVSLPTWLRQGRWWDVALIDLMEAYALGTKQFTSLDFASKALAVGSKTGSGAQFAELWSGTAEQRMQAIDYLRNDLELTRNVGRRILGRRAA